MLNHIIITGRITRDIELRRTQNGTAVCSFTVAVDRDYKGANGERTTDFIDCVAWRNTAEFISRSFLKGRMIIVDGSLQSRKYTDKNGNNRTAWEVVVGNVYFSDSKPKDEAAQDYTGGNSGGFEEIQEDGELPF